MSAAPSDSGGALPSRSEIEEWDTSDLSTAATAWRQAATASEDAFEQHRQNIAAPGGTTWEGDAKDAALDRVTADIAVVRGSSEALQAAAGIAENGVIDIKAAQREALDAIIAAENDGFSVAEDLSLTDTQTVDAISMAARQTAATEHAEDIRWYAERLAQADALVGKRLQTKATELEGIRFEGEGGESSSETVQLVNNEVRLNPPGEPSEDGNGEPREKPGEAPGQIGPFPVPKVVEDAAKKSEATPEDKPTTTGDVGGDLGDLLGANNASEDKPEGGPPGKPEDRPSGLPPVLSQIPPPPDKTAIDRQAAKVESARQDLAAAQARANDAAAQAYTQGAGAGPGRDVSDPLTQEVFDARAELTEQTRILNELNYASSAHGGPTAPVAPLPENAHVQGLPPEPPVIEAAAEAFAAGSKDAAKTVWDVTMPDVANMHEVATNWDEASTADRIQAGLDAAGMVPLPGAKILGEGIEHGIDALGGATRHVDDVPAQHVDEMPSSGHSPPPIDDAPNHTADAGQVAPYGIEDAGALLATSEATGGHLIERHVGQTFDDLSGRLEATQLQTVSTFTTSDEAAAAVSGALNHNQHLLDEWVANGAPRKLELDAPFNGGTVLERGADEATPGNSVKVVLKGDGNGGWYVLTGFPKP